MYYPGIHKCTRNYGTNRAIIGEGPDKIKITVGVQRAGKRKWMKGK